MKTKVNSCCDCGLPCMLFCPLRDDSYIYKCDKCGTEVRSEDLYEYDGIEICGDCLLEITPKAY